MNFPTSVYDTLFFLKKKIWLVTVIFLAFFFSLPIYAGMSLQHAQQQLSSGTQTQELLSNQVMQLFAGAQNSGVMFIFIFSGFICALIFLTWMHRRRKVDFYYSLPLTKKRLFGCCFSAGALAVIIPYLVNIALTLIVFAAMGLFPLLDAGTLLAGMAVNLLLFMLIYSLTAIAITLTGNSVVSGLLGLVFLGIGPLLLWLYRWLRVSMQPTWFSNAVNWDQLIAHSSPVSRFISLSVSNPPRFGWIEALVVLLLICLLILLAFRLFKIRPAESAGKTAAFPLLRPLLKYPLTIIGAATFGMIFHSMGDIGNNWLWFFIGAALGGAIVCQAIEIIYHADFRAILKRPLAMGITLVLFLGLCGLSIGDVGGYNKYLPPSEQVASVDLLMIGFNDYTYNCFLSQDYLDTTSDSRTQPDNKILSRYLDQQNQLSLGHIESPEGIEAAISLAAKMIEQPRRDSSESDAAFSYFYLPKSSCIIRYTLEDGETIIRSYTGTNISNAAISDEMLQIYKDPSYREHVYQLFSFDPSQIRVEGATAFSSGFSSQSDSRQTENNVNRDCSQLLQALRQELTSLSGEQMRQEMPIGSITFRVYAQNPGQINIETSSRRFLSYSYPVYASFSQTLALLADFGISDSDWEPKQDSISKITVNEYNAAGFNEQQVSSATQRLNNVPLSAELPGSLDQSGLPASQDTITYYDMEGCQRYTIYRDAADFSRLLAESYPDSAFYFNSFIIPYPNTMYTITCHDDFGNESYQFRYLIQP